MWLFGQNFQIDKFCSVKHSLAQLKVMLTTIRYKLGVVLPLIENTPQDMFHLIAEQILIFH